MPTKPSSPKRQIRRSASLSLGHETDAAVKQMFSLSPEESRQIIADTSPKPKPKRK